jgi:hypothetical protein
MKISEPDALFSLIKSLDPSEKRYFRIFATRHVSEKESEYLQLFDIMEAMESYEEPALRARLKNVVFAKNLSSGKNYLYQLILRSLRNYHSGRSAQIKTHELWLDSQILMAKGLVTQAKKLISKANKLTEQYHFGLESLSFSLVERRLLRQFSVKNTWETLSLKQHKCDLSLQKLNKEFQMLSLYENLFLRNRNQVFDQQELLLIPDAVAGILDGLDIDALSYETGIYYHLIFSQYFAILKKRPEANMHLEALIRIFEENQDISQEYGERYLNTLNNYFNNCFVLQELDKLPLVLVKLERFNGLAQRLEIQKQYLLFNLRIIFLLTQADLKAVTALAPEILKFLQRYGDHVPKAFQLTIKYNIASSFFLQWQFDQALEWTGQIIDDEKIGQRQDLRARARLLQLVLYLELDKQSLAEYRATSLQRILRQKKILQGAEILILKYIRILLNSPKLEQKAILQRFAQELEAYPGWEEFMAWINWKCNKK